MYIVAYKIIYIYIPITQLYVILYYVITVQNI